MTCNNAFAVVFLHHQGIGKITSPPLSLPLEGTGKKLKRIKRALRRQEKASDHSFNHRGGERAKKFPTSVDCLEQESSKVGAKSGQQINYRQ
jgi:hypothetical protein